MDLASSSIFVIFVGDCGSIIFCVVVNEEGFSTLLMLIVNF